MANKIQIKRGPAASLPTLDVGEPGFTTDTKKLYIGASGGNVEMAKKSDVDTVSGNVSSLTTTVNGKQGKYSSATITLTSAGWSNSSQSVAVSGVTASNLIQVSPVPADVSAYASAGIICTAQAANQLTFTCTSTPSANISVNVVIWN